MGEEAGEVKVSASIVVVGADNAVKIIGPVKAELYDEPVDYAGYDKCLAWPELANPAAAKIEGLLDLPEWVKSNDRGLVIIHTSNRAALHLGDSGKIGLTSDAMALGMLTITKKLAVLTDHPLKPLTVADLRAKGLVP